MNLFYTHYRATFFFLFWAVYAPLSINAQAPNISYSGVATAYLRNAPISSLTPTNSGGAVTGTLGVVTTFAGSGASGSTDGTGTAASFNGPNGVAVDASGNIYVIDNYNNRIRKITAAGVVTTFAGSGTAGYADGTGTAASFRGPNGITVDEAGNVYLSDTQNHRIRKITAAGVVTTLAGSGTTGATNGTGTAASFNWPEGVAVDASGNVYVAGNYNNSIRKVTSAGVVTTLAGSGTAAYADGTGAAASFNWPKGVAVDASGNVYVADYNNHRIRKITAAGGVTTLAGSGTAGAADGTGTAASFKFPAGIVVDASGNVYVGDLGNNRIRKITAAGVVTTLAGSGTAGYADGTGTAASFNGPRGIDLDASGNVYVADQVSNRIRKISQAGYSISPALPTGLSIDPITGVISGTPTVLTTSTTYTITARRTAATAGTGTTTVTFSVVAVLPVELVSFSGKHTEGGNLLTWQTASEVNNKGFEIERLNGSTWEKIGFKTANHKASTYQFTDNSPLAVSYYRLRQLDNDGKETLSKVVSVAQTGNGKCLKVYPNPVSSLLTIEVIARNEATEGANFQILNLLGQQVLTGKTGQSIGVSALPQGTYFLKVGTEQAKFIKQ